MADCPQCHKHFDSAADLRSHYSAAHLLYFPYACLSCGEWFASRTTLEFHFTQLHPNENLRVTSEPEPKKEAKLNTVLSALSQTPTVIDLSSPPRVNFKRERLGNEPDSPLAMYDKPSSDRKPNVRRRRPFDDVVRTVSVTGRPDAGLMSEFSRAGPQGNNNQFAVIRQLDASEARSAADVAVRPSTLSIDSQRVPSTAGGVSPFKSESPEEKSLGLRTPSATDLAQPDRMERSNNQSQVNGNREGAVNDNQEKDFAAAVARVKWMIAQEKLVIGSAEWLSRFTWLLFRHTVGGDKVDTMTDFLEKNLTAVLSVEQLEDMLPPEVYKVIMQVLRERQDTLQTVSDEPTTTALVLKIADVIQNGVRGILRPEQRSNSGYQHHTTDSLESVWASLSQNARLIFMQIAKVCCLQEVEGLLFWQLYRNCKDEYLLCSEAELRQQLMEFYDHNLTCIRMRSGGGETVVMTIDKRIVDEFLCQKNAQLTADGEESDSVENITVSDTSVCSASNDDETYIDNSEKRRRKGTHDDNSETTASNVTPSNTDRGCRNDNKNTTRTAVREQMIRCEKLVILAMQHQDAWPFRQPVNLKLAPDYYEVITRPMDLRTMLNKLKSYKYNSPMDVYQDAQLIFSNCRTYNEDGAQVSKCAIALEKYVADLFKLMGLSTSQTP